MVFRVCVSGTSDQDRTDALAIRRRAADEFGARGACVLYEQDVVAKEAARTQNGSRILAYQKDLMVAAARFYRDRGFLQAGDLVLANVEDGHPADSSAHLNVHRRYAADLAEVAAEWGLFSGQYGLLKRDVWRENLVPGSTPRSALEFDRAMAAVIGPASHVLPELYVTNVTSDVPFKGTIKPGTQMAWMLDSVARARYLSVRGAAVGVGVGVGVGDRRVAAIVNGMYQGGSKAWEPLTDTDLVRVAGAARLCDEVVVWAHVGSAKSGGIPAQTVWTVVERFAGAMGMRVVAGGGVVVGVKKTGVTAKGGQTKAGVSEG